MCNCCRVSLYYWAGAAVIEVESKARNSRSVIWWIEFIFLFCFVTLEFIIGVGKILCEKVSNGGRVRNNVFRTGKLQSDSQCMLIHFKCKFISFSTPVLLS